MNERSEAKRINFHLYPIKVRKSVSVCVVCEIQMREEIKNESKNRKKTGTASNKRKTQQSSWKLMRRKNGNNKR